MAGECPFCRVDTARVFYEGDEVIGLWDAFPVTRGHALLVTRRHVRSWFEATSSEQQSLLEAIQAAREIILQDDTVTGFNIGLNDGESAGQTIPHLHVHLIPRRSGDTLDPRGGVRHVIPGKANYLVDPPGYVFSPGVPHALPLIRGGDDPLLSHLLPAIDRAVAVDIAVAFTMSSGTRLLLEHLRDLVNRGGRLRFLTGDYLDVTDPAALASLLDLNEGEANVELRVFESQGTSFHLKSYILRFGDGTGVGYVGSSNLSKQALTDGYEWNYRVVPSREREGFEDVCDAFEKLFRHPRTRPVDFHWLQGYEAQRSPPSRQQEIVVVATEKPEPPPKPHAIQQEALAALKQTRLQGNTAGLVVLATGLGKTWLSAFDSNSDEYKSVLFVAHREEILNQAISTFRRIRPMANLGRYTGQEKNPNAEVLFASIQTLGRKRHLGNFEPDAFDYIVVDEFHHAAAKTYRNLIDYFVPKFMLGLTATPERTDGGDLLGLCQENLVFSCGVVEGIQREQLCPFRYYGVPDLVDYSNIPWRSTRFDEAALTAAVATRKRAENALEQHRRVGGKRTIAFCCSQRHADFMAEYFRDNGLRAVAVHSGEKSAPRTGSLEQLANGEIEVVFAVDMLNEGVDIPDIDSVLMLRPTESAILWMQQFGRGLRKAKNKVLKVVDYIGNHRVFLNKPRTLLNLGAGDGSIAHALELLERGEGDLPPGCEVTYDLEAISILRGLLKTTQGAEAVEAYYLDYKQRHGVRPTALEMMHDGFNPRRTGHGNWARFVRAMGDWPTSLGKEFERLEPFFESVEKTPMTKSFKMLVLLAMLNADQLPGAIPLENLVDGFAQKASRSAALRQDIGPALTDRHKLTKLVRENPVQAWIGGRGTDKRKFFDLNNQVFETTFSVPDDCREAFQEFTRELLEWRLSDYLHRPTVVQNDIVCKVFQSDGKPILKLPDREREAGVPEGWTDVEIDGKNYSAKFAKIAVNVIHESGNGDNALPSLMQKWFGPDAGQPGTSHRVSFLFKGDRYELVPLGSRHEETSSRAVLWTSYMREDIPPLFGFDFNAGIWRQGFVVQGSEVFLLVTLEKEGLEEGHQYDDRFLSPTEFQWQSQNRTRQQSKHGVIISQHVSEGYDVHLFVRKTKKHGSRAAPFFYCGQLDFQSWHGEQPINVQWRLRNAVPEHFQKLLEATG